MVNTVALLPTSIIGLLFSQTFLKPPDPVFTSVYCLKSGWLNEECLLIISNDFTSREFLVLLWASYDPLLSDILHLSRISQKRKCSEMTLLYDSKYHSAQWQCTLHAHQTGGGHSFKCFHIHLRNSTHVNSSSEITLAYFTLHSSKPHSHWVEML